MKIHAIIPKDKYSHILISDEDSEGEKKIEIYTSGGVLIEKCYTGVLIETEIADFGICQRDGGIEVTRDGKLVFSDYWIMWISSIPLWHGKNE